MSQSQKDRGAEHNRQQASRFRDITGKRSHGKRISRRLIKKQLSGKPIRIQSRVEPRINPPDPKRPQSAGKKSQKIHRVAAI